MKHELELQMLPQPNDTTCGPTCLHAVYRYYGENVSLEQLIREVSLVETGGTLAVLLACHALERGYDATILTYNLHVFDPSWLHHRPFDAGFLTERLRAQMEVKQDRMLQFASRAYLRFLELGGRLELRELNPSLIRTQLKKNTPILTGLSATYLYNCAREWQDEYDDVRGEPAGHFVVLYGYEPEGWRVKVADPHRENPRFESHYYSVNINRLIGAILLGIVTYDANLLIISPK